MENEIKNFKNEVEKTLKQNDATLNLQDLNGKTAIFIIDMINGFCKKGNLSSPLINAIILPIKQLIQTALKQKIDVIALNDAHSKNNPEFNSYPIHCLKNTDESKLVSELQCPEIKIIDKNSTNGFFMIDSTNSWAWDNIIVVGCCTDICVYQFALSCKAWSNQQNKNVNVIVPKTMTTTFDSPNHPSKLINALFWYSMLKNGITILKNII